MSYAQRRLCSSLCAYYYLNVQVGPMEKVKVRKVQVLLAFCHSSLYTENQNVPKMLTSKFTPRHFEYSSSETQHTTFYYSFHPRTGSISVSAKKQCPECRRYTSHCKINFVGMFCPPAYRQLD